MILYPEQTLRSINYNLSSTVYLKLNVGNVECPIVFVESGHCVLLISEVQDILSLLFSVCITVYFISLSTSRCHCIGKFDTCET